jgi:sugar phosphate isomerase/epimerase
MEITRRNFIKLSAGTAALLTDFEALSKPISSTPAAPGFGLLVFATNWGYGGTWDEFCGKIKKLGYDGAEFWCPGDAAERNTVVETFKKHGLKFGFLVGNGERDYNKHLQGFKTHVEAAASVGPVYINCHAGRDHFTFEQNQAFIDFTTGVTKKTGVPIYHETHRSRILYAAPVARQFMEKLPDLRLTLDISHWCCVHESLLEDQPETVALALSRAEHIHARVGHAEGPQVSDPRAPEWKQALNTHVGWWDKIIERKKKEGRLQTILTEFGPIDYMPAMPYTRQPLADQWDINVHMMNMLRSRYLV